MAKWHDAESAQEEWDDAPFDSDEHLNELLEVAREQCLAYAPLPADTPVDGVPVGHRRAQLMQARNLWNAANVSPAGDLASGDFTVRPHPLDWVVKQLLRPRRGVPRVR